MSRVTETLTAACGSVLAAVVMTWPVARHPVTTIPQDTYDPTLQAWQVAWVGHALRHDPLGIWTTNASFPEHLSLAFSDSLLGYAPFGLFGTGPAAAILRYNVLFVLSFALAAVGMYALVRQLGIRRTGAVLAALAFAYSPWRFAQAGHLNVLSTGGIPLALALLARGHGWSLRHGYRRHRARPFWALVGWLVAAGQVSLGFGIGLPFVYVLGSIVVTVTIGWAWHGRPTVPASVIRADLVGGSLFVLVTGALAVPYLMVRAEHPDARRSVAWLDLFSPPWSGFFLAGEHSWLWGLVQESTRDNLGFAAEMTLLPGFTLIALAGTGLFWSVWPRRTRAALALGVIVTAWLAMGTATPGHGRFGYLVLYHGLPGFDGSRTPGRLVLWTIILLCVLAAGAVDQLRRGWTADSRWLRTASVLVLAAALVGVAAEGVNRTPHPRVPTPTIPMAGLPAPILMLPTDELADLHVMLWSTDGFPTVVNGSSGYNPPDRQDLRDAVKGFPSRGSVGLLRALGVRTVVVQPPMAGQLSDQDWGRVGRELGIMARQQDGVLVFTL